MANIDGTKFISHSNLEMTQYLQKCQRNNFKLTPELTQEFYTKTNPRKGFTSVVSDWMKGLV